MKNNALIHSDSTKTMLLLAVLSLLALPLTGLAQYTFTNPATGSDNWADPTRVFWDVNGAPVSFTNATVTFFRDVVTPLGGSTTVTNDPATLTLNALTLNGLASPTTNTTVTIGTAGNTWIFDGVTPNLNLNGQKNGATNLTIAVNPNLALNQDLTIAGSGTATFNVNGVISGTNNLVKTGPSMVTVRGNNTYTGNTTISGGELLLVGPSAGGGAHGAISSSNATVNVLNGTLGLNSSATLTANTLLVTNNTATTTNSVLTLNTSTLNTSNTSVVMPNGAGWTINSWNMNGGAPNSGTHQFQSLIGTTTLTVSGQVNVNPGASLSFGTSPTLVNTYNFRTVVNGSMAVNNSSVTGAMGYFTVGGNTGSHNAQLFVTNGAQVFLTATNGLGSDLLGIGNVTGASSNSVMVAGTNALGQRSVMDLGGFRTYIGSSTSTNNWLLVGSGGTVTNTYLYLWGSTPGASSFIFITNGGCVYTTAGGANIGRSGYNCEVMVAGTDGGGNQASFNLGAGKLIIAGTSNAGTNCGLWVDNGGVVTNANQVFVGGASTANDIGAVLNYLVVTNGGKVFSTGESSIGYARACLSNSIVISGAGSLWNLGDSDFAFCKVYNSVSNTLTLANGGTMTNVTYLNMYGNASEIIFNNGTLAFGANGTGIITNATAGQSTLFPQIDVQSGGAIIDTFTNVIPCTVPFTADATSSGGGLTKLGSGTLILADGNTYAGKTVVSNGVIQLPTPSTLNTNTVVYLSGGSLNLAFTGTNVVQDLYLSGVRQPQGVYGFGNGTPSFIGTGYLQVSVGATNTTPPTLNHTISGIPGSQSLNLNWTGSFKLQSQTNNLSVGLDTNWGDYPDGGSSPIIVPINVTNGAVFFRLAPLP